MTETTQENHYFDSKEETCVSDGGNLPHWHQEGKIQFVTFRLGDSLPMQKASELNEAIENFKRSNPLPWDSGVKKQFRKIVSRLEERLLNNGYGECVLKDLNVRTILSSALKYNDGIKYELLAYVIMPNHVHMLILPLENNRLSAILHSIKSFSSNKINKCINRIGNLWMRESYDHIIRNEDELKHFINYIRNNPCQLPEDSYELYIK